MTDRTRTTYYVTADHIVAKYACQDLPVVVTDDGEYGFYANAPGYGMSKNYRTAPQAICAMFADHGCTNVRMTLNAPSRHERLPAEVQDLGSMVTDIQTLKSLGRYYHAGALAAGLGHDDWYGAHYAVRGRGRGMGMRSERAAAVSEYERGWQEAQDAIQAFPSR